MPQGQNVARNFHPLTVFILQVFEYNRRLGKIIAQLLSRADKPTGKTMKGKG